MPNYVPGTGCLTPKLMVVGLYPGREEDSAGRPFIGPSGQLVDELLLNAGVHRDEVYITNVVKYMPPFGDIQKLNLIDVSLQQQMDFLWNEEIHKLRPNCILAFGDLALETLTGLTGIEKYRGSILTSKDGVIKVVPSIHPVNLFPKPQQPAWPYVWKKIIQSDVSRAVEESQSNGVSLPDRTLDIAHSSLDVFRFFREYELLTRAANDIESINCVPICSGFAFNRHHALSIPLITKIGDHYITDMSYREIEECWRIIQTQFSRLQIIGQNYAYDEYKQNLIGFSIPNVVSDILLKARVIFPELPKKRLAMLTSLWTREPYYKDEGSEPKIGKKFNVEQFLKYNGKDCCVEIEIDEEMECDLISMEERFKLPLRDFYYNYVMKKHKFYLKMANVGWPVDLERQAALKLEYNKMWEDVHNKVTSLVGHEVNVSSTPQMFDLLYKELRFPARKRTPTSEDTIVALLGNQCKGKDAALKREVLLNVLNEKRIRSQLSKAINFTPDYDGRCKSTYNIEATETARSSTGVLKAPLRPKGKTIGLGYHTIPAHGRLGKSIKSMFICPPGMVIVQIDSSQAEARISAVLAEDWELLRAFDTVDIHRRTAGLLFGFTKSLNLQPGDIGLVDHLTKDGPERFTGKTFRHAGNYDMGKHTAMETFNTNAQKFEINMDISEWKAGHFLDLFHEASPKIRGKFHVDIKQALASLGYLINPFGRLRVFNGRADEERDREGYANIPQSTVADLVQTAALKSDEEFNGDASVQFVGEKHDSLALFAPENDWEPYAKTVKKHMEAPIDFSTYCTLKRDFVLKIPADVEISHTNYAEMEKVKL